MNIPLRAAGALTCAASLFLVTAFAQISAAEEDTPITRESGVSKLDKTFAIEATHGFLRDKSLALLAEHRAGSPAVRKFAKKIEDQRTKAHGELQALAKQTRLRLPERLDAHQRQQVKKLGSLAGAEFDKQFLQYIAETDYIRFFQFELNSGALRVAPPVRAFADKQLPILRKDMERARQLLKDYR